MLQNLWATCKALASHKKFVSAAAAALAAGVAQLGYQIDSATILTILSPLIAAILGQGVADIGKESD